MEVKNRHLAVGTAISCAVEFQQWILLRFPSLAGGANLCSQSIDQVAMLRRLLGRGVRNFLVAVVGGHELVEGGLPLASG